MFLRPGRPPWERRQWSWVEGGGSVADTIMCSSPVLTVPKCTGQTEDMRGVSNLRGFGTQQAFMDLVV